MTFSELQTRYNLLVSFEGYLDAAAPPLASTQVNEAWRLFSWESECYGSTIVTLNSTPGQAEYPLPSPTKAILDCSWSGIPLRASDEETERYLNPDWRISAGTPARWTLAGLSTLAIVPAPSIAAPLVARCVIQGPDMILGSDQPGQTNGTGSAIPSFLHEAVALRAAMLSGDPYRLGASAERYDKYESRYNQYVMRSLNAATAGVERTEVSTGEGAVA